MNQTQNMIDGCIMINITFIPFMIYLMFLQKMHVNAVIKTLLLVFNVFTVLYFSISLSNYPFILLLTNLVTMYYVVRYYILTNDDEDKDN